jgi:nucleotide-binding universal stress UspA family protein
MVGIVTGATIRDEAQREREAGMALLNRAAAILRANGQTGDERILERSGPAKDVIARNTRTGKFGLIVMGTHARAGVSRIILGSVADHVLRDVSCPVLLVHLPR